MNKITRRKMLAASSASLLAAQTGAWAQGRGGRGGSGANPAAAASSVPDTEWHGYANDNACTRYAALDQINASNFDKLELAWQFRTDPLGAGPETNNQCTPVLAKGRLFISGGLHRDVVALDAATGEMLWMYRTDEGARSGSRTGSGRGVSYWTDGANERIFFVTPGYQLIALDAKTGSPDHAFGKNGILDLREDDDQEIDLLNGDISLHATPLVTKNVIVVGAAHLDGGAPRSRKNIKGYTRGFDVRTGKRLWIFHTIPKKGEFGYETWLTEGSAEMTGNAGVWCQMAADEELGMVYIGVEMPTGDSVGIYRPGSGLFGESLVALDLHTGQRKWHFQMVHHGLWDRDVPCSPVLCDVPIGGKIVKLIAQPTKQALLYVFNRETGDPIWPIPELPVPKGDVPGEWYSPTQPFPSKPPAYDLQGMTVDDLVDFTPAIRARAVEVSSHYKLGPAYTPPVMRKADGSEPWATLVVPGQEGGSNWAGASYDPETHTIHLYSQTVIWATAVVPNPNKSSDFELARSTSPERATLDAGGGGGGGRGRGAANNTLEGPVQMNDVGVAGLPLHKPPYGRITAIDLSKGDIVWQVPHGETPDAIRNHPLLKGVKIPRTGQSGKVGTLTTKALVICGDAGVFTDETGKRTARLRAYDKATGEQKGEVTIPGQATGAPMTYIHGGRQHIVMATAVPGGGSTFVAFRLPAT